MGSAPDRPIDTIQLKVSSYCEGILDRCAMSRDPRISGVMKMYDSGKWNYVRCAHELGIKPRTFQEWHLKGVTERPNRGRPTLLLPEEEHELVEFISLKAKQGLC